MEVAAIGISREVKAQSRKNRFKVVNNHGEKLNRITEFKYPYDFLNSRKEAVKWLAVKARVNALRQEWRDRNKT